MVAPADPGVLAAAVRYLAAALLQCAPQVRDAVAAGRLDAPFVQATLDAVDAAHDLRGRSADLTVMRAAAERLDAIEAGIDAPLELTLYASHAAMPVAYAIDVRPNPSIPGARIVTVQCPFADRHVYRTRGHERHTHGWPAGLVLTAAGSLGTRVPHCDGAVTGDEPLPRIEIVVPAGLRVSLGEPQ